MLMNYLEANRHHINRDNNIGNNGHKIGGEMELIII